MLFNFVFLDIQNTFTGWLQAWVILSASRSKDCFCRRVFNWKLTDFHHRVRIFIVQSLQHVQFLFQFSRDQGSYFSTTTSINSSIEVSIKKIAVTISSGWLFIYNSFLNQNADSVNFSETTIFEDLSLISKFQSSVTRQSICLTEVSINPKPENFKRCFDWWNFRFIPASVFS